MFNQDAFEWTSHPDVITVAISFYNLASSLQWVHVFVFAFVFMKMGCYGTYFFVA